MARDMCPARAVGGGRVTLAPDTTGRFLPSVDRLEFAMHAARRALERGDTDGALGQLGVALKLKPEYDAAWILKGHVLRKAGNQEAALDSFVQSLKCHGDSKEGWMGLGSARLPACGTRKGSPISGCSNRPWRSDRSNAHSPSIRHSRRRKPRSDGQRRCARSRISTAEPMNALGRTSRAIRVARNARFARAAAR